MLTRVRAPFRDPLKRPTEKCEQNLSHKIFEWVRSNLYFSVAQELWAEDGAVICCKKMMRRHAAKIGQRGPSEKSRFHSYKLEKSTARTRWHFAPENTANNNAFLKCMVWPCVMCLHLMNVMWKWPNAVCYLSWYILELLWTNIKEAVKLSRFVKATQRC